MNRVTVEVVQGDIAHQPDIDAIVNAANARLLPGSGVAGAIHGAAGPGLAEECQGLAPIKPGQAVMTGGHGLPNGHVIHCLGPVYGVDQPSGQLLADCFRHALQLADRAGLESIAFPAISTGGFRVSADRGGGCGGRSHTGNHTDAGAHPAHPAGIVHRRGPGCLPCGVAGPRARPGVGARAGAEVSRSRFPGCCETGPPWLCADAPGP